jgi:2,4-dienoyl-CoA reductase-like NADH-dependent reductase (Old Yellow Enzyme family)
VPHTPYPRVASLKTAAAFRDHLHRSGIPLEFDDTVDPSGALAEPFEVDGVRVGNRFCILPMEGWDGTAQGEPSDLTRRRWRNFGISGAKLMWGGEAVAVRHDGRANPHQLMLTHATQRAIASLRDELISSHRDRFGPNADSDLYLGLQITHSGRFARPDVWDKSAPLAACHHPVLDKRFPGGVRVLTDAELDRLIDDFVAAARLAHQCGYQFVDAKACHGYLGHEMLGATTRDGKYGGSLENRMRFITQIVHGIRSAAPGLGIVVRVSIFDIVPHRRGADGIGVAEETTGEEPGFGVLTGEHMDRALDDGRVLLAHLQSIGVKWICTSAGSPYYNPHIQRPAFFPPLDGYEPPEDPLRGVARQIDATARLKAEFPGLIFVGSAYSYLQEWLPNAGQYNVRNGLTDFVGLGRITLSYPDLPADVLAGRPLRRAALCRTFSDCTTGPRMGMVSGCYAAIHSIRSTSRARKPIGFARYGSPAPSGPEPAQRPNCQQLRPFAPDVVPKPAVSRIKKC